MKPIIIILVIIFLIILILLTKARFIIYKNKENKLAIDFFIMPRLNIKINLDKILRKHYIDDIMKDDMIDAVLLVKNFKRYIDNKKIVKEILKKSVIRKIKVLICYDYFKFDSIYFNVISWQFLSIFKYLVDLHSKKVIEEEYNIIYQKERKTYILIDGMINIYSLIIIVVKNIKYIIGGIKKHGTSHK